MRVLAAVALASLAAFPAAAESRSASMKVSVRVVPRAILAVDHEPSAVVITTSDILRGYIDLGEPIVIRVHTNNPAGYLLRASKLDPSFTAIELSMNGVQITIREDETWVHRPYSRAPDVLTMRARLYLTDTSPPGLYTVPLAFDAIPF